MNVKANAEIPAMNQILCATISVVQGEFTDAESHVNVSLSVGFTKAEYDLFIKMLDVEYDDGYGSQELHGTIWMKDGTWMDRGEYDGSEWWNYQVCPEVPEDLAGKESWKLIDDAPMIENEDTSDVSDDDFDI